LSTTSTPRRPLAAVIGVTGEPTSGLVLDLTRLGYQVGLVEWPTPEIRWTGPRPVAALLDLRALTLGADLACRAVREVRPLRGAPLIGVVPEQEAPRLDLSLGFDDLLLSPYRLSELAARLRLHAWRADAEAPPGLVRMGPLTLDEATYEVRLEGVPLDLTLKEYQLLHFLLHNPYRVFTREDLLDRVWGDDYFGGTRTVDVHVRRVRAKTEAVGDLIETVRGVGYRFLPPAG
jgi:DNA-binding response OmpR family regulator